MSDVNNYRPPKRRKWLRAFYPIIGLVVMGIAGAIAYVGSLPACDLLASRGIFSGSTVDPQTLQIAVGGGIFLVIILLIAFVFAVIQPKDKTRKLVTEKALVKEREQMQAEAKAKKRRQQAMRKKMKQRNR